MGCRASAKKGKPELPPDVAAAVAAVDAAVRKLPAEADVKYSVAQQQDGGWGQRTGDPEPLNPGSKVRNPEPP